MLSLTYLFIPFAYLIGSISTAIITCKLLGLDDPRTTGSNNPGATNVLRSGGKKAGAITLIGDMLKGLIPVLLAMYYDVDDTIIAATGCAAFLGHVFPIYYGFKGGKGVATFYGSLLGFSWLTGLASLAIWGASAAITRYSSLSALISILVSPFILYATTGSLNLTLSLSIMVVIVFFRHKQNISRLLSGTESKIGKKQRST